MRHFNTAGPVNRPGAYKIDPLNRWNTEEILGLITEEKYFILHAPRQTGKTSCLLALRDYLNEEGKYFAFYANFEVGQAWRHNIKKATDDIVQEILSRMRGILKDEFPTEEAITYYKSRVSENSLNEMLEYLSLLIKKPIVMFIDEIDSLIGDTLLSVLRQMRAGYDKRPDLFPSSIILCGVRDIKDYRIHTSQNEIITGGSAFNIKTKSLRLGNFSKEEVIELYNQHTSETGQVFTEECFDLVMEYTDGQPWLVNALAREVTYGIKENRDRSITITPEKLETAKENLILERQTHLDQLVDKLQEDRVRRVILPMILGEDTVFNNDDEVYCLDLGLIKKTKTGYEISNSIYREIIPRELTNVAQVNFLHIFKKFDWIAKDGKLCIKTMLTLFKTYWNENSMIVTKKMVAYPEALPQLIIQGFLQRIVNGGGYITREYAIGRKRVDIMVKWKYQTPPLPPLIEGGKTSPLHEGGKTTPLYEGGKTTPLYEGGLRGELSSTVNWQSIILELKVIDPTHSYQYIKDQALEQTAEYAKLCGEKEAQLLIFDKDKNQKWSADEPNEIEEYDGVKIEIWKFR